MKIKVSDYIVEYFIEKGITDVFGYPGGMVTHLMDSFEKHHDSISAHVNYHEQGAGFAACGYSQVSGKVGVAYATSGPGAINLMGGICNAYFDSIPLIIISGQVNRNESKGNLDVRQRGFQETDIISVAKGVTKYACYVDDANKIKMYLDTAYYFAISGRPGPTILDIPMDVQREIVDTDNLIEGNIRGDVEGSIITDEEIRNFIKRHCNSSKRPCLLIGNGIKSSDRDTTSQLIKSLSIPSVTSMLAVDALGDYKYNFGFIGAYGHRCANFIVAKSDLIISIGARLDVRQVGGKREQFAPNAQIIRVDIDSGELEYKIRDDDLTLHCDAVRFLKLLKEKTFEGQTEWIQVCETIREKLIGIDEQNVKEYINAIDRELDENTVITLDVGQNQAWVAQYFRFKNKQIALGSGGYGSMGYSLPAAIGAYYAKKGQVISFNGDGGIQMNIQELQFIAREKLPITIVVFNNKSLGMIRHFQEMYFDSHYSQTTFESGYTTPDFVHVAEAFGISAINIDEPKKLGEINWNSNTPLLVNINLDTNTYVFPKARFGCPNQDQEPLLERCLYEELMRL